ncbi:MAG TPA: right-handed parallel beta-helix repeat-containing protein [Verrucomicrobiae bacterium]|nr:right-handed parallel beta-helix repeat-containing protein [Verrucomicrobiae bacterium]
MVQIHGGVYSLTNSFALAREDSGTRESPIVYCGFGSEQAKFIGGKELTGFKPVQSPSILQLLPPPARTNVLQVELPALGITDYGELPFDSFELFFNDKPMTLARWPNDGWTQIAAIPAGEKGPTIQYANDRISVWARPAEVWMHGYWGRDWADQYLHVRSIDPEKRLITIANPQSQYGYHVGARYYALNVLEELDEPGEWYLDRKTGILYFWPPSTALQGKAIGSVLKEPLFLLRNTSFVTISNLTFSCARGPAVQVIGGFRSLVARCRFQNLGGVAVALGNAARNTWGLLYSSSTYDGNCGSNNGIEDCDIFDTGAGALIIGGGNRLTLTPGNNFASRNIIARFNRIKRTMSPGIHVFGVGNRVDHNLIYEAPNAAIFLSGNDHEIEFNEIHDVCLETSDAGAIYMGRNLSERGNIFRHNLLHDIPQVGIFLDDFAGGATVFGNIFDKVNTGVQVSSGSANHVEGNLFTSCNRAVGFLDPVINMEILTRRLEEVHATRPPYTARYPELRRYTYDDLIRARGTKFTHNVVVGGTAFTLDCSFARQLDLCNNLTNLASASVGSTNNYTIPQQAESLGWNGQLDVPVAQIGPGRKPPP